MATATVARLKPRRSRRSLAHWLEGVVLVHGRSDDGAGAVDEKASQMLASSLGDAHQDRPVPARELSRHQSEPRSHVPPVPEVGGVTNCGYDSRGGLGPYAFDPSDPLAGLAGLEHGCDLFVEGRDPAIEIAQEAPELRDGFVGMAVSPPSDFARISGIARLARVIDLANAKPRSSSSPRIWLTKAVR